jgi:hypothetical protein
MLTSVSNSTHDRYDDTTIRLTAAWGAYCSVSVTAAGNTPIVLKRPFALKPRAVPHLMEFDRTTKVDAVGKRARASTTRVFMPLKDDLVRCNFKMFQWEGIFWSLFRFSDDISVHSPAERS